MLLVEGCSICFVVVESSRVGLVRGGKFVGWEVALYCSLRLLMDLPSMLGSGPAQGFSPRQRGRMRGLSGSSELRFNS